MKFQILLAIVMIAFVGCKSSNKKTNVYRQSKVAQTANGKKAEKAKSEKATDLDAVFEDSQGSSSKPQAEMSYEETKDYFRVMTELLGSEKGQKAAQALNAKKVSHEVEGDYERFTVALKGEASTMIVFKDLKFESEKLLKTQKDQFILLGTCFREKCGMIFLTIAKIEDGKAVERYPYWFRKVDGRYMSVKPMKNEEFVQKSRETKPQEAKKEVDVQEHEIDS